MAIYERQYTQGVGWENEPSINTPISAENLNQMDNAIQDVDLAVYNAILQLEAKGGRAYNAEITSAGYGELDASSNLVLTGELKEGDLIFAHMAVDGNPGSYSQWDIRYMLGATSTSKLIYKMIGTTASSSFAPTLPEDTWLVLRMGSSLLTCIAIIEAGSGGGGSSTLAGLTDTTISNPSNGQVLTYDSTSSKWVNAAGGGGARIFSDHITSRDSTTLLTSTAIISYGDEREGDMVFLICDIDAVWPNPPLPLPGWGLSFGDYGEGGGGGTIVDYRGGSESIFTANISSGTILVISKINSTLWALRMLIPAAGGGGSSSIAYNANVSSASNDVLIASLLRRTSDFNENDLIFLHLGVNATWENIEFVNKWKLQYYVNNVAVSKDIDNGISSSPYFNYDLPADTWLVLKVNTLSFTCIAKIDPSASTLAGLTDTNISSPSDGQVLTYDGNTGEWINAAGGSGASALSDLTDTTISSPSDGQYLKYDGTSSKWINAAGGGGGASTLADLTDTTITTPTASQPLTYDATSSKWINGGVIPTANGGTGNAVGYIQTGKKSNTTAGTRVTIEGTNNEVTNTNSHAEGESNKITGYDSHAEGFTNTVSGNNAHAEGGVNTASGHYSHAEGLQNKAQNQDAHAEGINTTASGSHSHTQNNYTTASGENSSAAGEHTTAGYKNQFVIGKYNDNKSTNIFEVGNGTGANAKVNVFEVDGSGNTVAAGNFSAGSISVPVDPTAAAIADMPAGAIWLETVV